MRKVTSKTTAPQPLTPPEELQALLVKRFRADASRNEPVVYEFTNDRALLHQYYRIREIMYRKVHHAARFDGREDVHDKIAHILIARRGRLVVGGCRLIVREPDEEFLLPMESDHFDLRASFPQHPLTKVRHGEISRFAVLDEDQDKLDIMLALSKVIIEKCIGSGLAYAFLKAPGTGMARNWRRIGQVYCGLPHMRICTEIAVPEDPDYPEIDWRIVELPLPASKILPVDSETDSHRLYAVPTDSLVH